VSKLPEYNPNDFELILIQNDLCNKKFHSTPNPNKTPYTIVMPPPNITGMLHMGHILNNTIQDVLIRYKRLDGYEVCWIPGLDHASIATETKVTHYLAEKNIDKKQIGRKEFITHAMKWKDQYGGIINQQLKRLGISCDWCRERFTMDDEYSQAVLETFIELYNNKLIYKGKRMVNWCPISQSAISDEEVEYVEEQGFLWHFAYPIKNSKETIIIATTRPETIFGDSAVMVHPDDDRYKHLIGEIITLPFVGQEIPIIADSYVDPEFGTGAVKVTPAHDPNDYEVGLRHNLDMPEIMTMDGRMANNVPETYRGLDRFEARQSVVSGMKHLGLLVKVANYTHKVGYSQRGHVPIETLLSEQWFISMKRLVPKAKEVVENDEIKFYPNHWKKTYFYWLDNIKDWCISRQLWWGHRIPIFTCESCDHQQASLEITINCPKCKQQLRQEESVLDTWASSWIWSYMVHKTEDEREYYHTTDTLVTGPDIIFFWVARMIMASEYFRNEIPFRNVYFTGIIRDDLGRKMSKSLGNSPDPMDIMMKYGADALRFSIIRLAPLGNDILYSSDKVELGKRFANKIWNAARFIQMHIENNNFNTKEILNESILEYQLDDFDESILTRLNTTTLKVRDNFDKFRINDVAKDIYDFIWGEFCDHYIESSKVTLGDECGLKRINKLKIILGIFHRLLHLLHPIMPFITEKLYQEIFCNKDIAFERYPTFNDNELFEVTSKQLERLEQSVYLIREIRAENNVPPSASPTGIITASGELKTFFEKNRIVIQKIAKLSALTIEENGRITKPNEVTGTEFDFQVFVDLDGIINKDHEIKRLHYEIMRLEKAEKNINAKLTNFQFIEKAPENIITKEKNKLQEVQEELQKNKTSLKIYQDYKEK